MDGAPCTSDGDCANCSAPDETCACNLATGICTHLVCIPGAAALIDDDCDGWIDEDLDPDVTANAVHCCACGEDAPGPDCCEGTCVALDRESVWPLDGSDDLRHCGACGTECDLGQRCCGGACVDTRFDEDHCGGCCSVDGMIPVCRALDDPDGFCGACGVSCTEGSEVCCEGACVAGATCE